MTALVTLDTFNNTFLGADTLNNPSNNVAFAAAGRGRIPFHVSRIVSSRTLHNMHLLPYVQYRCPEQLHKDPCAVVAQVSQVVGGLLGAYAAIQYIPPSWQTDFAALSSGVKPGVSLWAGSACEAILAFLLNMAILYSLSECRCSCLVDEMSPCVQPNHAVQKRRRQAQGNSSTTSPAGHSHSGR